MENESEFILNEKKKEKILYEWQHKAIDFFFKNDCSVIYECPTGTGKSLMAVELLRKIWEKENKQAVIIVPKNVILETGWYKELFDNGVSLADIGVFYGDIKEYGRKVTITNVQNIGKIDLSRFGILLIDEIHNSTVRVLEILSLHNFEYKIGLTATLRRGDNGHWAILKYFGFNKYEYSPSSALKEGVLNKFDFINVSIEMDSESYKMYNELTQQINSLTQQLGKKIKSKEDTSIRNAWYSLITERKKLTANYLRKIEAVKKICSSYPDSKILVFNEFNSQTNKFRWELLDIGISAGVVHSKVPKKEVDDTLIKFRTDKINIILTTKVLDEGYNVPKVDVGIICAGNSTNKQTIQRMGRVLRKKSINSKLYQIYIKGTVEEKYALIRTNLFRKLCENYKGYQFLIGDTISFDEVK